VTPPVSVPNCSGWRSCRPRRRRTLCSRACSADQPARTAGGSTPLRDGCRPHQLQHQLTPSTSRPPVRLEPARRGARARRPRSLRNAADRADVNAWVDARDGGCRVSAC
jgi:hypothetical protein